MPGRWKETRNKGQFETKIINDLKTASLPSDEVIGIIRQLDPLRIHENELLPRDRSLTLSESKYAAIS